jgi:hypothetical protein
MIELSGLFFNLYRGFTTKQMNYAETMRHPALNKRTTKSELNGHNASPVSCLCLASSRGSET